MQDIVINTCKICNRCGESLPTNMFFRDTAKKDGLSTLCKKCRKEYEMTESGQKRHHKYRNSEHGRKMAREYNSRPSSRLNRAKWEKTTPGLRAIAKYRKSEKYKCVSTKRVLMDRFGLTIEQYNEMSKKQNGVCAICGKENTNGRRLAVDHNHKTNKIRELLCNKCNSLIGFAGESEDVLRKSIEYINKHNGDKI